MAIIRLDEDECWVLHEWVRRERSAPAYGEEHDLGFMTKVWRAILAFSTPGENGQHRAVDVDFTRGELLQISRQVSTLIMAGSRPVGREILKKALLALLGEDDEEAGDEPIPAVFRNAYEDDPNNSARSGADPEAFSG